MGGTSCSTANSHNSNGFEQEIPICSRDLENHYCGEFSCAMVSANPIVEDQTHLEAGRHATFVGLYDGFGFEASRYVSHNFFHHLRRLANAGGTVSEEIIRNAFDETENGFLGVIKRDIRRNKLIATCGSCCLVGVIWNGTLYTANLGDSRAVIGYMGAGGIMTAQQLTSDHNVKLQSVRNELMAAHPTDSNIVVKIERSWRIKGKLRASRSIGHAYLKHPKFAIHFKDPITAPVIRADPDVQIWKVRPEDRFIIYASYGFWSVMTNENAVQIVHENPRLGIAKKLIVSALQKVARFRQMELSVLMKESLVNRGSYHDDISVIVIFIDQENANFAGRSSVRGLTEEASTFTPVSACTSTSLPATIFDFTHNHLQHWREIKSIATAVATGSQMAAILRQLTALTTRSSAPTHWICGIIKTIKARLGTIIKTVNVPPFEGTCSTGIIVGDEDPELNTPTTGSSAPTPNSHETIEGRSSEDIRIWSRDLENHFYGQFSCAMVSANPIIEDHIQVEAGRRATFCGVYDGHGHYGFEASTYVCNELYHHLQRLTIAEGVVSEEIIRNAFSETENRFLGLIRRDFRHNQLVAACGSCCLVGVIWNRTLYIANLGDSRAVMGYAGAGGVITTEQLTSDHSVKLPSVRNELMAAHPSDRNIVVKKRTWRVKGKLMISRVIGDAYLKDPELSISVAHPKYHLSEPLTNPVLRGDPDIFIRQLQPRDKFIIYASDGLWDKLKNEEAVRIVHENPRLGIAKKLIESALEKVAKSRQMELSSLMKESLVKRRTYHDDISVVVIFIDQEKANFAQGLSVRGFTKEASTTFDF